MDIILKENVKGLGRKGEMKTVKPGFFKNFLLPHGKAQIATKERIEKTKKLREALVLEQKEVEKRAQEIGSQIQNTKIELTAKASDKGKLFAAIHEKDIVKALAEQAKIQITEEQVEIAEPIKTTGEFEVKIKLSSDVTRSVNISVNPA